MKNNSIKEELVKKALWLEYVTLGYNILEGLFSIGIGVLANSIVLIGFGIDSFIESFSDGILIWRFKTTIKDETQEQMIEQRASQLVAYSFFIFSLYVTYEAIRKLIWEEKPEATLLGIIIAILSLILMPILTWQKYETGKLLRSRALVADSKQTLACSLLSIILLFGLSLNYFFGFWWADPLASLGIVLFMVKEGWELL